MITKPVKPRSYPQIHADEGFAPLVLPTSGFDLYTDRQYVLDPVARSIVEDEYGYNNVARVVNCIAKKTDALTRIHFTKNERTGEITKTISRQEGTSPMFAAIMGFKKVLKFSLDLERVENLRPFYVDAHKVKDEYTEDEQRERAKRKGKKTKYVSKEPKVPTGASLLNLLDL